MPLTLLGIEDTQVTDLTPLAGMKLEKLYLSIRPGLPGLSAIYQKNGFSPPLSRIGHPLQETVTGLMLTT